ncbi:hypothetical protein H257_10774 [Aphanomyces astaci]|uniref:Uncharacterized protein n=1 Tax=Aphanomyces astaci TaxID=112090 RepID=W4G6V1_APHAT|nr:hypothetical protein H257_10774 [Aphanomyces astaci]ETV74643.1 hypothetical protein H257_10774 [Aphanomyces astaci]|eukprot:XP_009835730.1 hypothetical protein H257_10774 [Aphanomyces astaci]
MNFVRMCDIFENMATVLEGDIAGPKHPDSWLAVDGAPQLNPCPPFYPDQFVSLCNEFLDESGWTDSIYVAASIKGACLPPPNRAKMVALPVVHGVLQCTVCKMILSSSYEISRYGVFVLSLFNKADALAFKFDKTVSDTIHDMQATDAIPRMRDIARIAGNIMVPLPAAME